MRPMIIVLSLSALSACGGGGESVGQLRLPLPGGDGGTVLIGSPCVPDLENETTFDGFSSREVTVQSIAGQPPGAPVCLVLDFQGRVGCPYGQDASGAGPDGTACKTPAGAPVTGAVAAQCVDAPPSDRVIWSCRCADAAGQPSPECRCPSAMTCADVLPSVGPTDSSALAGSYCVPSGMTTAAASNACSATCDPVAHPCQ